MPDQKLYAEGLEGFPLFCCALLFSSKVKGKTWLICPTEEISRQLYTDSKYTESDIPVIFLPSGGRVLYSSWEGSRREYEQLRALSEMESSTRALVITDIRAMCSPLPPARSVSQGKLVIEAGKNLDVSSLVKTLSENDYCRSDSTSMSGDFTVRGEVIDIFPHGSDYPVRIYLDWDKVEKICRFEPVTQRINKPVNRIEIPMFDSQSTFSLESSAVRSYMGKKDYFFFVGDKRLETSFASLQTEAKSLYRKAYQEDRNAPHPLDMLFDFERFESECGSCTVISDISGQRENALSFEIDGPRSYFGNITFLKDELKGLEDNRWDINIIVSTALQKTRLSQILSDFKTPVYHTGTLSSGFSLPSERFIVICESEIFGRRKQVVKTLQHSQSSALDSFVELHEGDYVVHVNYGIGVFLKIDRVRERDYIKIRFADDENLYVPIEQADLVQRYIGSAGESPKIDRLGSGSWENKKARARKSAEKLAQNLVELYARRQNSKGFPFARDNDWQMRFEAEFEFDETEDQISCIQDVKDDMESPAVMDRLICGDVGYGKTEIAFRAAFKAIMSGKQVAFLAPTTILSEQHFRNFCTRSSSFPLHASLLNRMIGKKDQNKELKALSEGRTDIIFGTHRILQKDVIFKDLGLLIVDEEQRFGVKDKERIKELKANVDCLSLSATPIPRTLYMSLLKIRDMSLLTTPPVERKPIRTVIGRFDISSVEKAVRDEISRHGQVFYLHNRIETLQETADMLRRRIPEAIIETAHGQMDAKDLEETMRRFVYEGIQVLVSTTIIENGIDIPNVNTIIIDRADRYGLSQLYQLKGRVGRSDREAYAYLFYPSDQVLNEQAVKRLKVISENTGLGSGFKVAMKDMEIRGAGNLLGKEQSGFMSSVGLDMYIRLLDEEIARIRKTEEKQETEVFLELDYSGYIPDSYISDPSVKFDVYKKIATTRTTEQLERLTAEINDRFGRMPEEVANLLYICELRIVCRKLDIYHMKEKKGDVLVEFSKIASISIEHLIDMIKTSNGAVTLDPKKPNVMTMKTNAISLKDKALFILEKLQRLIP